MTIVQDLLNGREVGFGSVYEKDDVCGVPNRSSGADFTKITDISLYIIDDHRGFYNRVLLC